MRCSFCVMVLVIVVASDRLPAQDTTVKPTNTRAFLGESDCATCHTFGQLKPDDPRLKVIRARSPKLGLDGWVKLDEWLTWGADDKHNQAFISLRPDNKRAKQMADLLGYEVHRDKRCLACHTGYPLSEMDSDPKAPNLISEDLSKDPRVTQGIGCEGCHAPSGDGIAKDGAELKGWNNPHKTKDTWRFLSGNAKWEKYGYADVRSPSNRTRLCLSCHLGNAEEGKIVTHEMYAAGHPPLPGFELSTFVDQLPKHWRDFGEKSKIVKDEFLKLSEDPIYGRLETYQADALNATNNLLVAALVSYSENLKLSAALANPETKTPLMKKPEWPELAQFECFACHHDLRDASWRQSRALRGTPGRPLLRAWPTPLTALAVKQAGGDEKSLFTLSKKVNDLLNAQPFGGRQKWDDVVADAKFLDELAKNLERRILERGAGMSLLRDFVAIAETELWDYDSARQIVWATQVLRKELGPEQTNSVETDFAEIEQYFVLKLIDGKTAQQQIPGDTESRDVTLVDLEKTLPKVADYDAITIRNKFRTIAGKLK